MTDLACRKREVRKGQEGHFVENELALAGLAITTRRAKPKMVISWCLRQTVTMRFPKNKVR